ncbi:dTDP-4-dehydrorhamnose reductase [Vibrio spartinae]|uniref:dTDP-4-dehydrorhamnose reductase n=1 Tax=Vibrio spartinae TaxID=1918945 RepID=A0A1N6M2W4_9VIBR|nr:dTDP-4-dehydrorhamnose reductase [Vibrio spartinae]SIO93720.1 dTDP-4-dehydrorhamnose reductase [Vibrio spartinae]
MILVTGTNGLLGSELKKILCKDNTLFSDKNDLDITSKSSIADYLNANEEISLIINCAAGANAEYIQDNEDWGRLITVDGPKFLALESAKRNIKLIHISTDYVFDGEKNTPYTENDLTNGLSLYGKFKSEGEKEVLKYSKTCAIIRTSWLFSEQCKDFIGAMINASSNRKSVNVVFDQVGSPTYVPDLAKYIVEIGKQLNNDEKEIFHLTNEGICSWYDIACCIMRELNIDCEVNPIRSNEYPTKAPRPHYSVLDKKKVKDRFGFKIRHYQEALSECLKNIKGEMK